MVKLIFLYLKNKYEIEMNDKNILISNMLEQYENISNQKFIFLFKGINLKTKPKLLLKDLRTEKAKIFVFNLEKLKQNKEKSNIIVCPICYEDAIININSLEISLSNCPNNHNIINFPIKEFMELQLLEEKIIIKCNICGNYKKYYKKFYICSCNKYICPLCINFHQNNNLKNHNIINYNERFYKCKFHNKEYILYCKTCKINLCEICEEKHSNHNIFFYKKLKSDENRIKEIRKDIKNFNNNIKENFNQIKEILNKFVNNIINNITAYIDTFNKLYNLIENLYNYQNIKTISDLNIKKIIKDIHNYIESIKKLINFKEERICIYKIPEYLRKQKSKEIKIFDEKFVKNNKEKCFLYCNHKKSELSIKYRLIDELDLLFIKLIEEKPIDDISNIFYNCETLFYLINFYDYEKNKSYIKNIFFNCKSLILNPELIKFENENKILFEFILIGDHVGKTSLL